MEHKKKSVLFLPFLQIPSGHHQVAKALMDGICQLHPQIDCEKVDILAYSYGRVEKLVSSIYLKWIKSFPQFYNVLYRNAVYKNNLHREKRYRLYELLFLAFMKKLVVDRKPDLIVCTHSLPAYMLNYLKEKESLKVPVVNVYTDYFIHEFWGVKNIDFHFVPNTQIKSYLMGRGVKEEQIFVTGIPIHHNVKKQEQHKSLQNLECFNILVSGGSLGVGEMDNLLQAIKNTRTPHKIKFYVLCGKNKKLFSQLTSLQIKHIVPYPYIENMEEIDSLYDQVDAILTKPGGVTISESLMKRKPIFIYHALPGQEKINQQQLTEIGVVIPLEGKNICEQVISVLQEKEKLIEYHHKVDEYHHYLHPRTPSELLVELIFEKS
jgi:processive 1,2-diacylglycerol beta-glucosyltransferase